MLFPLENVAALSFAFLPEREKNSKCANSCERDHRKRYTPDL